MLDLNETLSTSQVAREFGVTPQRVRQLERAGVLVPAVQTPLGVLFDRAAVEALRQVRETAGRGRSRAELVRALRESVGATGA